MQRFIFLLCAVWGIISSNNAFAETTATELVRKAAALCPNQQQCSGDSKVEEYLTQAQKIDNTLPKLHETWGHVYSSKGFGVTTKGSNEWYTKANTSYQRWADLEPAVSQPYQNMAHLEYISGNTDKALQYITTAGQLEPNSYIIALKKCQILAHGRQQNFWQAAIASCSYAITLDKDATSAYYYRSYAHKSLGNTAAAAEDAEKSGTWTPQQGITLASYLRWFKTMACIIVPLIGVMTLHAVFSQKPFVSIVESWWEILPHYLIMVLLLNLSYIYSI